MNILNNDIILLAHAALGGIGCLAALWVFVETLNARPGNAIRIQTAALLAAVCMVGAWICGGYWYVHFYPRERGLILKGSWPLAHTLFMETKEHLFFITGILALLLPIATREQLYSNSAARKLVLSIAGLTAITGLVIEGSGAVIDHGVKVALLRGTPKGTR